MMAANYRHIGGLENRLGRHYSRFSASGPAAPLAAQSLARRKSRNGGSNRRSWASSDDAKRLAQYWATKFDFDSLQQRLAALPHECAVIDDAAVHLVHVCS